MPNIIKKYDVDLINVYPALLYLFGYNILPPIPSIVLLKLVSISLYDAFSNLFNNTFILESLVFLSYNFLAI